MRKAGPPCVLALLAVLLAGPAQAHTGDVTGGFLGGLAHPVLGPDHLAAMVAVGLWGAFLGPPAIFALPIVFPLVMAAGAVLAIAGLPLAGVETGIAVSAVVLGLMVAAAARPPLWIASAIVGAFAVFHGYAHGAELPADADAVAYCLGFVMATGLLHLAGITLGLLVGRPAGRAGVRALGGLIACAGAAFLWQLA
jgi:urease accessory protein